MRKRSATTKSEETRRRIYDVALARFRKAGFEATTMRDIAKDAAVALGAAYYYFPSKEAIVMAYYEETQRETSRLARAIFAKTDDPRERLRATLHPKLDILAKDRKLLSALFRSIADPSEDLSVFGEKTRAIREDSIALFDEAVAPMTGPMDPDARRVLALALWSLHMGLMLFFIRDASRGAAKTRALAEKSLDLVATLLPMAPMLGPLVGTQVAQVLAEAGLLRPPERAS